MRDRMLAVAHAACLEVGLDPGWIEWSYADDCLLVCHPGPLYWRAALLAELAVGGPHYMTLCASCFHRGYDDDGRLKPCTEARDVLRGADCFPS